MPATLSPALGGDVPQTVLADLQALEERFERRFAELELRHQRHLDGLQSKRDNDIVTFEEGAEQWHGAQQNHWPQQCHGEEQTTWPQQWHEEQQYQWSQQEEQSQCPQQWHAEQQGSWPEQRHAEEPWHEEASVNTEAWNAEYGTCGTEWLCNTYANTCDGVANTAWNAVPTGQLPFQELLDSIPTPARAAAQAAKSNVCANCGTEYSEDSIYCWKCGVKRPEACTLTSTAPPVVSSMTVVPPPAGAPPGLPAAACHTRHEQLELSRLMNPLSEPTFTSYRERLRISGRQAFQRGYDVGLLPTAMKQVLREAEEVIGQMAIVQKPSSEIVYVDKDKPVVTLQPRVVREVFEEVPQVLVEEALVKVPEERLAEVVREKLVPMVRVKRFAKQPEKERLDAEVRTWLSSRGLNIAQVGRLLDDGEHKTTGEKIIAIMSPPRL